MKDFNSRFLSKVAKGLIRNKAIPGRAQVKRYIRSKDIRQAAAEAGVPYREPVINGVPQPDGTASVSVEGVELQMKC